MRHLWISLLVILGLVCSVQAMAASCWRVENLQSKYLKSLHEYRELASTGCSYDNSCKKYYKYESAKSGLNLLIQNNDDPMKSIKTWRGIDEACGTRMIEINDLQAEVLAEILNIDIPFTSSILPPTPSILPMDESQRTTALIATVPVGGVGAIAAWWFYKRRKQKQHA